MVSAGVPSRVGLDPEPSMAAGPSRCRRMTVSSQATDGAGRTVGTHRGPTRIHLADYSLRQRRDGNAGTTILYHLRNRRRPPSGMTAGHRELLEDGHRRRFRRGRRTFRGTTGRDGAAGGLSRSTPRRARKSIDLDGFDDIIISEKLSRAITKKCAIIEECTTASSDVASSLAPSPGRRTDVSARSRRSRGRVVRLPGGTPA